MKYLILLIISFNVFSEELKLNYYIEGTELTAYFLTEENPDNFKLYYTNSPLEGEEYGKINELNMRKSRGLKINLPVNTSFDVAYNTFYNDVINDFAISNIIRVETLPPPQDNIPFNVDLIGMTIYTLNFICDISCKWEKVYFTFESSNGVSINKEGFDIAFVGYIYNNNKIQVGLTGGYTFTNLGNNKICAYNLNETEQYTGGYCPFEKIRYFFTTEDEVNAVIDQGDKDNLFAQKNAKFYFNSSDFLRNYNIIYINDSYIANGTTTNNGNNEEVSNDSLTTVDISGIVSFLDSNGNSIAIPDDAVVRIVANNKYEKDIVSKVNSDGSFQITKAENDLFVEGSMFSVSVFKNHINPEQVRNQCGEDFYKGLGNNLAYGSWSTITVNPSDYIDKSNEVCAN